MHAQVLKALISLTLIVTVLVLQAQTYYPVRRQADTISFSVGSVDGHLSLFMENPVEKIKQQNSKLPETLRLYMEDGNLAIDYRYPKLENGVIYDLRLALQSDYAPTVDAEPWELLTTEVDRKERIRKLQWLDRSEEGLYFGETFSLEVERLLLSTVDCEEERPSWGADEQWAYWFAGVAGGILVGLGQDQRLKKEDDYSQYLTLWEGGSTAEEAQPFFDRANNHQDWSRWLSVVGWGISVVDTIWWLRARKQVKTQQRVFDTYCAPIKGLTIAPVWDNQQGQWLAMIQFQKVF